MRALDRKLVRDVWKIRGQALAIALVIGCGIAVFVMTLGMIESLEETRAAYYDRYRFADVFGSAKRAPEHLAERIRALPGVALVAPRIVKDVTLDVAGLDEPATGRLVSVPERSRPVLNDVVLRSGRWVSPGRPDEVIASEPFAEAHGLRPGDHFHATINGHRRRLEIVGIGLSPEFVYAIGPGALMPDNLRFSILWMGHEALAAAFDLEGAFNDVTLRLRRDVSTPEVIARLDDLLEPYGGLGAYDRSDQTSDWFVSGEIDQLRTMATVLPTIFLAVAAFLLNLVVSRLIATEREQIGLLKAFGYGNTAVGWHYLKLVIAMASLGLVLGLMVGGWLGRTMAGFYIEMFRFPFLYYQPSPATYAAAAVVTLGAAVLGTLGAVRKAVALPPAEAMIPPPPPSYRRSLEGHALERLIDQPSRMILRHVFRWPVRSALTTVGIAMAVALMIASLHWLDSIEQMLDVYFYQEQRHDAVVSLEEAQGGGALGSLARLPGVIAAEPFRSVPVRFHQAHLEHRGTITGLPPNSSLQRVLDSAGRGVALPPEGIVLSATLANLIAVEPGDPVTIEVLEGRRPTVDVPVAAVIDNDLGTPAYMDMRALNRLMLEGPTISGAYLLVDGQDEGELYRTLKDTPAVAAVTLRSAAISSFQDTLEETMVFMIAFYVVFGGLLAFGVVYNSARIALSERARELASLRVLGFTRREVSYILLGELLLLTLVALPTGCILGYLLAAGLSAAMETELYRVPFVIEPATYGIGVLVVVVAAMASSIIVRRQINRLDLIEVLKTRE
ncbi:MAG: ABC transporter permease [Pseudomonadota bacterium]